MEAHEALERFEKLHQQQEEEHGIANRLARHAALSVAIIAAFLAIASFFGNEAVKDAIQGQTKVSDAHSQLETYFTQDEIFNSDQLLLDTLSASSEQGMVTVANAGNKTLQQSTGSINAEQKVLQHQVSSDQKDVKHANNQHLLYELAEVLLQIA